MSLFLKSIQTQLDNCAQVSTAYEVQGPEAIDALMEALEACEIEVDRGEVERVLGGLHQLMMKRAEALRDGEQAVVDERSDDPAVTGELDAAAEEASGCVRDARDFVKHHKGASALKRFGLSGSTPRDATTLRERCAQSGRLLSDADEAVTVYGASVSTRLVGAPLLSAAERLKRAEAGVARERRELQLALTRRDRSREALEQSYRGFVSLLVSLFELAGKRRLAAQLRPTTRRVKGDARVEETGAGSDATAGEVAEDARGVEATEDPLGGEISDDG